VQCLFLPNTCGSIVDLRALARVLVNQVMVLRIIELTAVVRWSAVLLSYDEEPVCDSHEFEFGVADVMSM
jgi:hypothetical protein